jgi:hypothetical protein
LKQEDHKKVFKYGRSPYCFINDTTLAGPYDELHWTLGKIYDHFHLMAIICRRGNAYLVARVANILVTMWLALVGVVLVPLHHGYRGRHHILWHVHGLYLLLFSLSRDAIIVSRVANAVVMIWLALVEIILVLPHHGYLGRHHILWHGHGLYLLLSFLSIEAIIVSRVANVVVTMCLALVGVVLVPPIMAIMVATTDFDMVKTKALKW